MLETEPLNKLVHDKQPPEAIEAMRTDTDEVGGPEIAAVLPAIFDREIAGLDIAAGLNDYNGDADVYITVLRAYAGSTRTILDTIETFNEDALTEYQRAVHSIKGASLNIFADSVGKKAAALEDAAMEKNIDYIGKETPVFLENAWKLVYDIESMLSHIDAVNTKPVKDTIDRELLLKLLGFCEKYDMDGVDSIMAEIEQYQYEADNDLSAWLRENVDVVDFEGIAGKLSVYKK